jgi:hypothetical protein
MVLFLSPPFLGHYQTDLLVNSGSFTATFAFCASSPLHSLALLHSPSLFKASNRLRSSMIDSTDSFGNSPFLCGSSLRQFSRRVILPSMRTLFALNSPSSSEPEASRSRPLSFPHDFFLHSATSSHVASIEEGALTVPFWLIGVGVAVMILVAVFMLVVILIRRRRLSAEHKEYSVAEAAEEDSVLTRLELVDIGTFENCVTAEIAFNESLFVQDANETQGDVSEPAFLLGDDPP